MPGAASKCERTLSIYDVEGGTLLHHWPIARATRLRALSVAGGYAAFFARGLHVVKLSSGREATLLPPGGKPAIDASITSKGLFFLYRLGRRVRLGFVPLSWL